MKSAGCTIIIVAIMKILCAIKGVGQTVQTEKNISEDITWDFSQDTHGAYNLSTEELREMQKGRKVCDSITDTALPEELVSLLKEVIVLRQLDNYAYKDMLASYEAREQLVEQEEVIRLLGEAAPEYLREKIITSAYLADLDKDGTEELVTSVSAGGNGGNANLEIWRWNHGEPTVERYRIILGSEMLLRLAGEYYFIVSRRDFYSKEPDGYEVYSFAEDGQTNVYEITLESDGSGKEWHSLYENGDKEMVQSIENYLNRRKQEIENSTDYSEGYEILCGKAEAPYGTSKDFALEVWGMSEEDKPVEVDLDNDGEIECVYKRAWYPMNAWQPLSLGVTVLKMQDAHVRSVEGGVWHAGFSPHFAFEEGTDYNDRMQLWFEEFEGRIYTFSLERISRSSDYVLTAAYIEDGGWYPALQYLLLDCKEYRYEETEGEAGEDMGIG